MRTTLLALLLTALALTTPALAADAPAFKQPLTLVQLTAVAQENNPTTRAAWAAIRASEAGVALAMAGYWPTLSADFTVQRSRFINFSGFASGAQTRYSPGISLTYLLWDFGNRSGTVEGAKYALTAARLSRDQAIQDVMLQVEQAYYQVIGLQALVDADRQALRDAETSLDAARRRRHSGLATVGDVYQAEAAAAGARLTLQQAQGQLASARGQLASAVGYAPDTALPLVPWDRQVKPQLPRQPVGELLEQARRAHPSLLAAKAQIGAALANLEAVRARGLPTLTADAQAGLTHVAGLGNSSSYSAALTLSVPLFAGFGDRAANRQAKAQVDVQRADTDQLRQQVEVEVWQAYQNLHTAAASVDTTATQLKSARQAADVMTARYRTGLASILDVLSAQSTLANARVQQIQAQLNWFAALAALGHAVGGLNAPV